ncbi:MAG: peptidase [Caulobacter sp.]|nr:peptidase [Caulobacter sp.]
MSSFDTAVRGRCFRALAPALAGAVLFIGGVASSAAVPANVSLPKPAAMHLPALKAPLAAAPQPAFAFASPLPGREIGSPFGLRRLPWEPTGRLHEGVDMAAPSGEAVHVICAGTVTRTGDSASYGRFVEVKHADGLVSFYAHLGRVAKGVRSGVQLAAGDKVGSVGDTGHSTGAHLHFEMRKDGRPLNPAMFINQVFATLADLPLKAAGIIPRHVRLAQVSRTPGWTMAANTTVSHRGHRGRAHAVLAAAD